MYTVGLCRSRFYFVKNRESGLAMPRLLQSMKKIGGGYKKSDALLKQAMASLSQWRSFVFTA
jgi:hypothetical protein